MYRVLAGILALLFANTVFALESEYKNSLTGIDLHKTSDSSYSIDLFTSKQINEPVKIVKKSDLSYYILLPETKNTIQNTAVGNAEIRSIEMQTFPYAGSDVRNGYTKININTTKPIRFNITSKTLTVMNSQNAIAKEVQKNDTEPAEETSKVQKKNSFQSFQEQKDNHIANSTPTPDKKLQEGAKQNTRTVAMAAAKIPVEAEIKNNSQAEVSSNLKQEKTAVKQPFVAQREAVDNQAKSEEAQFEEMSVSELVNSEEEQAQQEDSQKPLVSEDEPEQPFSLANNLDDEEDYKHKPTFSETAKNKLSEYGLNFKEIFLMLFAAFMCLIVVLQFIRKNQEVDTRLKNKSDFSDKKSNNITTLVPKKTSSKEKQDNKYFVLDRNVRQTGLIVPTPSEIKSYNLSNYKPSIQNKVNKIEKYNSKSVTSEYDIIQNILREDSYIDYSGSEISIPKEKPSYSKPKPQVQHVDTFEPIVSTAVETVVKEETQNEPKVLSSVEIAPRRGFMCVSYNNTINLIGYIFDDVFALYNFQASELDDYTIKFRVTEKTKFGVNYLVRINGSKLLISVTKSSMNMEVAM